MCLNQCALEISALKRMLNEDRINLVDESLKDSKRICLELGISTERRIRKKRQLPGEESSGSELSLDAELKQEMLCAVDRITEELTSRFEQLFALANRFDFLMPANLLNESYHSQLDQIDENVPLEEFLSERKRLQHFVMVAGAVMNEKLEHPLELLQFIQKFKLADSLPNVVILLRILLTTAVSVASCERSFSKLKLIKSYLRSSMGQFRLTGLSLLSIERELADAIDFDHVIYEFSQRKGRKVQF